MTLAYIHSGGAADHGEEIVEALCKMKGVEVIHHSDRTFLMHIRKED